MEELRSKAYKKAKEKADFFGHLAIYILVNIMLIGINLISSPNDLWFFWVTFGWGIGVLVHFFGTFVVDGMLEDYINHQTEREMERMRKK